MNFKTVIIILITLTLVGCGVKSDPKVPPGSVIPSYDSTFLPPPADSDSSSSEKKESE